MRGWLTLTTGDRELDQQPEVQEYLQEVAEMVEREVEKELSIFNTYGVLEIKL